jgi:hypothetical protein
MRCIRCRATTEGVCRVPRRLGPPDNENRPPEGRRIRSDLSPDFPISEVELLTVEVYLSGIVQRMAAGEVPSAVNDNIEHRKTGGE